MRDTGKTPWGILLGLVIVSTKGVNLGIALDVVDLSGVSASSYAGT